MVSYETIISNQRVTILSGSNTIAEKNDVIESQDIYITNLKAIINDQADRYRRDRVKHIGIGARLGAGVMVLLRLIF